MSGSSSLIYGIEYNIKGKNVKENFLIYLFESGIDCFDGVVSFLLLEVCKLKIVSCI